MSFDWMIIYEKWIFNVFQPMDTSNDLVEIGYPLWFVCQNGYIGWFDFNWVFVIENIYWLLI
jgi:hypothetical protein